jgi:hippurate hydrolase
MPRSRLDRSASLRGFSRVAATLLVSLLLLVSNDLGAAERVGDEARDFVDGWLRANLAEVIEVYRDLHRHPELSLREERTAARVAEALRAAGYEVESGIGGHGVVGVLENGKGPTLLLRGDMDGLPIEEDTGLEYASQRSVLGDDGVEVGVMHACGHDVHTANLIGVARIMAEGRSHWSGTLVLLGQPAEELGRGAREMIADDLFDRIPRPDYTLALHVESDLPAGQVGLTPGWAMANVDAVDVTLYGRGGHGARPHSAVDPIVASAYFVTALQTLVSRRVDPKNPAVVTVGSIHAGHKHNVIPDEAHMQITVRSYTDEVRAQLLEGIEQQARDTCALFQCPKPPRVDIRKEYTPAVYNDPALVGRARAVFSELLGPDNVVRRDPSMGGEDFGRFARHLEVPGLLFRLGAADPKLYEQSLEPGGEPLPALHSSHFAPPPRPTLETGLRSTVHLAFELLPPS